MIKPPHILELGAIGKDTTRSVEEQMRVWIAGLKAWMKEVDEQNQIRRAAQSHADTRSGNQLDSIPYLTDKDPLSFSAMADDLQVDSTSRESASAMGTPVYEVSALHETDEDSVATPTASKHEIQLGSTKRRRANGSTGTLQTGESPSTSTQSQPWESSSDLGVSSSLSSLRRVQAEDSHVTLVRETSSASTIKDAKHHGHHINGASGLAEPPRSTLGFEKNTLSAQRHGAEYVDNVRNASLPNFNQRDSIRSSMNFHVKSLPTSRRGSLDGDTSDTRSDINRSIDDVVKRMSRSLEKRESRSIGNKLDFISTVRAKTTVEEARDAYFNRLSTLPAPTLSNLVPESLMRAIDAIRGILFALSQLHTGQKQFLAFCNNESVKGVFARVMDPATDFLHGLVNALDRFDSMSRRRLPTVSVTRQVFEACRDAITVFIKITSVLNLQVPALRLTANHRYARTMLMLVSGSMAEAIGSWRTISSIAPEVKTFLQADPAVRSGGHRPKPSMSNSVRTPISPIPEKAETQSPQGATAINQTTPSKTGQVTRGSPLRSTHAPKEKSRRNAGSFSAEDVQVGMMLGPLGPDTPDESESDLPPVRSALLDHSGTGSIASQLIPEAENEDEDEDESDQGGLPPISSPAILLNSEDRYRSRGKTTTSGYASRDREARGYRRHIPKSSMSSEGMSVPLPTSSGDLSPTTPYSPANVVDDGVLDTLEQAAAIADTVWLRLSEELAGSSNGISPAVLSKKFGDTSFSDIPPRSASPMVNRSRRTQDALAWIARAEGYTGKLHESLMQARANPSLLLTEINGTNDSALRLPFDAQNFIKAVVVVSKLVKAVSAERPIPSSVKNLLQRLTAKTSECAILLEVSSLKPAKSASVVSSTVGTGSSLRPLQPSMQSLR